MCLDLDLRSLIWSFGESIASLYSQPMYRKMCPIDIFVDLQPFGCNLKGGLFNPAFDGLGGQAPSTARPWIPIRLPTPPPLTHMVYLQLLAGFKRL